MLINAFIFVLFIGFCRGGVPCSHPSSDACTEHQIIDEPHRSAKYTASNTTRLICDTNINVGWYRFQADGKDVDMPTSCVDVDHCGTYVPIWLQGTLPSIKGAALAEKACINRGSNNDLLLMLLGGTKCCHETLDICVKNCDSFNVYWLRRTPGCSMAYCAGNHYVCPTGRGGPSCAPLYPHMTNQPTLEHKCDNGNSKFECKIPYDPSDKSANFIVTWLVGGRPLTDPRTHKIINSVLKSGDRIAELNTFLLLKNTGKDLQCEVTSFYHTQNDNQTLKSKGIFVGIHTNPVAVNVSEKGTPQNVTLSTSIPFCSALGSTPSCDFAVEIKASLNSATDTSTSQCVYDFEYNGITKKCEATVPVIATRDFVNDGIKVHEIGFKPIAKVNNSDPNSFMWLLHTISPIHVTTIDSKSGFCKMFEDPHIDAIAIPNYDHYGIGYHVMYRSKPSCKKIRHLEVQVRTNVECSNGGTWTCTCAVVASEGNDYVEIDACTQIKGVHHLSKKSSLLDGTTFHTDLSGKKFYINFPSGARLTLTIHASLSHFHDVNLHIPSDHNGCAEGSCGSFNKNNAVDPKRWVIRCEQSLFHDPNKPRYNAVARPRTEFCPCDNTTHSVACTGATRNPLKNVFAGGKAVSVNPNQNSNRNTCGGKWIQIKHRSNLQNVFKRSSSWPTPSGITLTNATSLCKTALKRANLFQYCKNTLDFYSGLLTGCIEDIKASDSLDFLEGYSSTYDESCQITLSADPKYYVKGSDGQLGLPSYLTSDMCPNECSMHGTCIRGKCTCQNGYQGPDCSVKAGAVPLIHFIFGSGDETNVCDARSASCSSAFVFAENLFYTQTLQCKVEYLMMVNGTLVPNSSKSTIIVDGLFSSSKEVECPLPSSKVAEVTRGTIVTGFIISVTTNGRHFSNKQNFVIYDSMCQNCQEVGTCHVKSGVCAIDGYCRRKGEQNSQQQVCEPSVDPLHWTSDPRIKEIDHYTASETGCDCPDDPGSFSCACCQNGGCPCGYLSPHQCVECGHKNLCG